MVEVDQVGPVVQPSLYHLTGHYCRSTTSRARRRRRRTSTMPSRRSRLTSWVLSTCLDSPNASRRASFSPAPPVSRSSSASRSGADGGALLSRSISAEIYGSPTEHPQKEDYWGNVNCVGPRACYDEGKRVAEALTYGYHRQDGVEVRVARIFNCFGPF